MALFRIDYGRVKEVIEMIYKKWLHMIAFGLVIFGAVDLGLYGLRGIDVIEYVFRDSFPVIAELLNTLVGISGVYLLFTHFSTCKVCNKQ
jgi:uncharacterized membrane protein YuzA (DUF378 family)